MAEDEVTDTIPQQLAKPIKWIIPDSIRTDHATHLVVQQSGSEFLLLFFEVQVPILSGTPEEQFAALKDLPSTEARCVSKVVMSAENLTLAVGNLVEGINRLNEMLRTTRGQENVNPSGAPEVPFAH